jgi:hypothetical protein
MSTLVKNEPKLAKTKKVSVYSANVFGTTKGMRSALRSTNKCIKFLLLLDETPKHYKAAMRKILKDDNLYKAFNNVVTTTKKGKKRNPSPFTVALALYNQLDKK